MPAINPEILVCAGALAGVTLQDPAARTGIRRLGRGGRCAILSDRRQHMNDNLTPVKGGAVEAITRNGEAARLAMSPESCDDMVHAPQRGHIRDQAIDRINNGKLVKDARQRIPSRRLGVGRVRSRVGAVRGTENPPVPIGRPMNQAHLGWIANFIWGIADDVLRDLYVRGKYRDVILPMTVLRRLDSLLEPSKPAVLEMKTALDQATIIHQDQGTM